MEFGHLFVVIGFGIMIMVRICFVSNHKSQSSEAQEQLPTKLEEMTNIQNVGFPFQAKLY